MIAEVKDEGNEGIQGIQGNDAHGEPYHFLETLLLKR
jgi:hypothetical protein